MYYIKKMLDYRITPPSGHMHLFTGNRVILNNALVMGAGNALACKEALPSVPALLVLLYAERIQLREDYCMAMKHPKNPNAFIGVMFTKDHYKDPSELVEVIKAIEELKGKAIMNPNITYHLPYPGCGLGRLNKVDLDPYVEQLPDNVYVYYVAPK